MLGLAVSSIIPNNVADDIREKLLDHNFWQLVLGVFVAAVGLGAGVPIMLSIPVAATFAVGWAVSNNPLAPGIVQPFTLPNISVGGGPQEGQVKVENGNNFVFHNGQWTYAGPVGAGGGSYSGHQLAEGGIVTGPMHALIGEAGPEAVIPLDHAGFGGDIHFHAGAIQVGAVDSYERIRDLADQIANVILKQTRMRRQSFL